MKKLLSALVSTSTLLGAGTAFAQGYAGAMPPTEYGFARSARQLQRRDLNVPPAGSNQSEANQVETPLTPQRHG